MSKVLNFFKRFLRLYLQPRRLFAAKAELRALLQSRFPPYFNKVLVCWPLYGSEELKKYASKISFATGAMAEP